MYEIHACPCCASSRLRSYPALIAPFIAAYVLDALPSRVVLLECGDCSFRFFASRFDAAEVRRLYSGYRGPAYFKARHRREFWYSQAINDGIGGDAAEIAARNAGAMEALQAYADTAKIRTVLDYGGDRGQFIPAGLGEERCVFEISGLEPVEGVSMLRTEGELAGRTFDLILLANVLEHSSEPGDLLKEIRKLAKPEGSVFMVTAPLERFSLAWVPGQGVLRKVYERVLDAAAALPWLAAWMDLYSTVFRLKLKAVPPLGFIKLHEHINFFETKSLQALLMRAGFTVSGCRVVRPKNLSAYGAYLLCVARAAPA